MERSRSTSEQVVETVDREVRQQISNLGLATQADIRRLESRIEELSGGAKKRSTKKRSAKKASAKKRSTKKASAKKRSSSS